MRKPSAKSTLERALIAEGYKRGVRDAAEKCEQHGDNIPATYTGGFGGQVEDPCASEKVKTAYACRALILSLLSEPKGETE